MLLRHSGSNREPDSSFRAEYCLYWRNNIGTSSGYKTQYSTGGFRAIVVDRRSLMLRDGTETVKLMIILLESSTLVLAEK